MKLIHTLGFLLFALNIWAQEVTVSGNIFEQNNPKAPLTGANVYWIESTRGTTSDTNGYFELTKNKNDQFLVISFVGYLNDTITITKYSNISVYLTPNLEIDEVLIQERQQGQYINTLNPIQTTKVTASELQKAACCNLSESFETNASVDVSFADAVTGAKQIKMLGLSGIYVQTISENIPSIRGMAAPYGLGYVPGAWMESIQISKGTSSVLNGYEAISGQINVEYKKPNADEILHVNLYGNDALKSEANLNYAYQLNDNLSTMILLHAENHSTEIDDNNDQFLDMPHVQQINFMNRWFQVLPSGGDRQFGIKVLNEHRQSGQVGAFDNKSSGLYGIDIKTDRYEFFFKNGILLPKVGTSIAIVASGSYHKQDAFYGKKTYLGTQSNGYLNLIYQGNLGTDLHTYKTGVSFLGDSFSELLNNNQSNHQELVPGAYFEYSFSLKEKFNLLAGIRADYSTQFGAFVTPRIHAKWNITNWLTWRGSLGKGYRTSIPIAENSYLLASSREIRIDANLKQEEAVNTGTSLIANIPIGSKDLTFMLDYYHTNFMNQIVRDVDSDVHEVHFMNLEGQSYSNAIQAELIYEVFNGFTLNAAYRINDVKQTINGQLREMPLTGRYKGLISASYATRLDKWQFDFTSQFSGGGRLPDPNEFNPLWNSTFDPFTLFNAQITKNFRKWSFYVGSENLGNFSMDKPIIASDDPWGTNFDGSMIWGPVHGRKIYFGLRYTIKDYK